MTTVTSDPSSIKMIWMRLLLYLPKPFIELRNKIRTSRKCATFFAALFIDLLLRDHSISVFLVELGVQILVQSYRVLMGITECIKLERAIATETLVH